MFDFADQLNESLKTIFKNKNYLYLLLILTALSFALYLIVPVYTIPGNDLLFWLKIMPWWGYPVLVLFSIALGLLFTMKIYEFRHSHSMLDKASDAGSIIAVIFAGLYTTAACAACISTFFAFIGAGGALFLNKYRDIALSLSVLITIFAIYFTARKINSKCDSCNISSSRRKK